MPDYKLHELAISLSRTEKSKFWLLSQGVSDGDNVLIEHFEGSVLVEEWKGNVIRTLPKHVATRKFVWAQVEVKHCPCPQPEIADDLVEDPEAQARSSGDLVTVIITVTSTKSKDKKSVKQVPARLN